MTREEILSAAKQEHDKVCRCSSKYLMSCNVMAREILKIGDRRAKE